MTFRKFIFWLHLIAGLVAGLVIAVMSFTGAALAFEKEITAFAERDARRVAAAPAAPRLSIDELLQRVRTAQPDARPSAITVSADPTVAVAFAFGRGSTVYANPYTGEVRAAAAPRTRAFLAAMTSWHRWLALSSDQRPLGKAITGACNAAFLFLAVSGLWLWWPRKWRTKGLKRSLVFLRDATGKARDWNWHNVIGFWSLPVLIVLTASGLVISYRWASDLVYRVAGETPPAAGPPPGAMNNSGGKISPPANARPLAPGELLLAAQKEFPAWTSATLSLATRGPRGPGSATAEIKNQESGIQNSAAPITVALKLPGTWPRTAATTLTLDPFSGAALKTETFADLTPGRRARTWLRFLHTGEALGWAGQFIAGLACLGSCVLVYTGFALAWHRFFIRPREKKTEAAPLTSSP